MFDFAAICCLFAGILFGSTTKASAEEPIESKMFEMVSGASIRITDGQVNGKDMTNGLAFSSENGRRNRQADRRQKR